MIACRTNARVDNLPARHQITLWSPQGRQLHHPFQIVNPIARTADKMGMLLLRR